MKIKCRNCFYINHYHSCELCKTWYYNEKKLIKYFICSKCYKESEKIYLDLMNCNELYIEEEKEKKISKLPKKYKSLLIDFDGI